MEERVFGRLEDNPLNYMAVTSLQKKIKEVLAQGQRLGTAKGIYIKYEDY